MGIHVGTGGGWVRYWRCTDKPSLAASVLHRSCQSRVSYSERSDRGGWLRDAPAKCYLV